VAFISTGIAVVIGTIVGLVAGFYRGFVDTFLSRLTDVVLAFPILLLGLGLAAACSGADGCFNGIIQPGLPVVIMVIAIINWTYIARIVRGQVLSLREKEFVEASRSLGASNWRIMFRDILPNLVAPIIVYATLFIPANILLEAALSFLGVGVQPPRASWGDMLSDAVSIFDVAWWFMFFPGMALLLTVLAFNLVGDGLQDALNPKGTRST
jgi:peptide/nickel transport system permease protein